MNLGLENKTSIITGAAQGLGKAIALAFAAEGGNVIIADIDLEKADLVLKQIKANKGKGVAVKVDVSCSEDIDALIDSAIKEFSRIDIVVNNAGICPRTDFEQISEQEWDKVLAINLKSVFLLSQKVFPHMKSNRYGRIINIASGAGKIGGVQVGAHYSASKAAIICLTKTMALKGANFGINVNAVCPGVIGTEMTTGISEEQIEKYKEMIPLGRVGSAQDVANMVLFLASEAAGYITGEIADVNGGLIMD